MVFLQEGMSASHLVHHCIGQRPTQSRDPEALGAWTPQLQTPLPHSSFLPSLTSYPDLVFPLKLQQPAKNLVSSDLGPSVDVLISLHGQSPWLCVSAGQHGYLLGGNTLQLAEQCLEFGGLVDSCKH